MTLSTSKSSNVPSVSSSVSPNGSPASPGRSDSSAEVGIASGPKQLVQLQWDYILTHRIPGESNKDFSRRIGISPRLFSDLNQTHGGREVFISTALEIAKNLALGPESLIRRPTLPVDPEYYTALKWSYFIDDRRTVEKLVSRDLETEIWIQEAVHLQRSKQKVEREGFLTFEGFIRNAEGAEFAVTCERCNDTHFVMVGRSEGSLAYVFHAVFTYARKNTLAGIWVGADRGALPKAYRMFLSAEPMEEAELLALMRSSPVRACLVATHLKKMSDAGEREFRERMGGMGAKS